MYTHEFNVYETLAKLDALLETGHESPSPMDRAEYKVLTNILVRGASELIRHLALHDVLAFETAETIEPIVSRQVNTATTDSDGGFSDEIVTIDLPSHLVPYGAISEVMKTWNVGTIETVADLSVLARLWARYLAAANGSEQESTIFDEWYRQAERVTPRCLSAVQLLHAAGLLEISDLRTGQDCILEVASSDDVRIVLHINTRPDVRTALPSKKSSTKKTATRKRSR